MQIHENNISEKILAAAKLLFIKQGYKKTTIRQIVKESGVLTGSIYHFYKNKEDIFRVLLLLIMKQGTILMDKYFADESPAFKYAAINIVGIKAAESNEFVRESYYECYTSNIVFEQMVEYITDVSERMLRYKTPDYTHEDYYIKTLLIRGAMRSCIAKFYFRQSIQSIPSKKCAETLTRMSLSQFGFDELEIKNVLMRIEKLDKSLSDIAHILIKESINI